jgi:pyridoxamine 5'-phosphate oxidase
MSNLHDMRQTYDQPPLSRADLATDPLELFAHWFAEHRSDLAEGVEANAMALATVDPDGKPSVRMVLLKELSNQGFSLYSNYESRKGRALAVNPHAALLFYWPQRQRQVRVEGEVSRLPEAESEAYFASRPAGSRLAAAASAQSSVVPDRATLEAAMAALSASHDGGADLARPASWGGYRLQPTVFEFWQGRPNRLHDRFRYRRAGAEDAEGTTESWIIERLAP